MAWTELILSLLGGSLTGFVSGILYLRPKLQEAMANAQKAKTEASDFSLEVLLKRIDSTEKLYAQQGQQLDEVRKQVLTLQEDIQSKNEKIVAMEGENKCLANKVTTLEKENKQLSSKVSTLETENKQLANKVSTLEGRLHQQ